jgi:hypothetical protein
MTFESGNEELLKIRALREQRLQKMEQAGIKANEKPDAIKEKKEGAPKEGQESKATTPATEGAAATSLATEGAASPASEKKSIEVTTTGELSEKAKGKLPASASSPSVSSAASGEKLKFQPTAEWV